MKDLFQASRVLLLDMASTLLFLAAYVLTGNLFLAVALGMALGIGQIAWHFAHRQPVEALQWLSLLIILVSGTATFLTEDPLFVMLKPTVIYIIVGVVMLLVAFYFVWRSFYCMRIPEREPVTTGKAH